MRRHSGFKSEGAAVMWFFFSSRRRHTRFKCDWSSDVCSSDLQNYGAMREMSGGDVPDQQWLMVTMDNGMSVVVGGGWSLPLGYPNFSTTWIEMIGTEGAVMVDDSHKDVVVNTVKKGMQLPMSTMPGEFVEHTYAGPMAPQTVPFLEAVVHDREVMVKPEHARMVMEVYMAADLSAERNEALALPLTPSLRAVA